MLLVMLMTNSPSTAIYHSAGSADSTGRQIDITPVILLTFFFVVVVALLFYVHGKHLRSCRDGQLT